MANLILQGWGASGNPALWGWQGSPGVAPEKPIENSILDVADDGVEMAIIISLFCDRRIKFDIAEPLTAGDRRGWLGDNTLADGDLIGSHLWTLSRYKMVDETTIPAAENMIRKALKWMIDDGVTKEIQLTTTRIDNETLQFAIGIKKPAADAIDKFYFTWQLSDNTIKF